MLNDQFLNKLNINFHTLKLGVWMLWDEMIIGDILSERNINYDCK